MMKKGQRQLAKVTTFITTCLCLCGYSTLPVRAEGSKELVSGGGDRPYLEWSSLTTANVIRQTPLKVYVKAGETVNLGSSVPTSFDGKDIVYRSPLGTQNGFCDVLSTGFGFINTIAKETAGPLPTVGGYTPCSFVATETGLYSIEFHGPLSNGATNPTPIGVATAFPTDNTQASAVAAWDVTIRDSSGIKLGRLFTNYVAMNMGANSHSLNSKFFIQTKDGFRYRTSMNGVDPFGFLFFASSRGYIDRTDNSTLYRSARASTNTLDPFQGNVQVQRPDVVDTTTDTTHLVFVNAPDTEVLFALGIPSTPVLPAAPTSFKFTGATGSSGNQTTVGAGGYFSFGSSSAGTYEIIIDTNNDGVYDPSVDRILQNPVTIGTNVVTWDGKNASGVNLPPRPGNAPYNARARIRTGEYHFPMLDAENNPSGFVITMQNAPGPFSAGMNATTVFYNDDNYTAKDGTAVDLGTPGIPSSPRNATVGVDSASGKHAFSSNYGDFKGIDTWAFFPSQAVLAPLVITTTNQANVQGKKSVKFLIDTDGSGNVTVGDRVQYTITYSNLAPGNSNATNFVINDALPSQLTFVSAAIASQTAGNTITLNPSYSGTGALTNTGTLRVNDTLTITVTATINSTNSGNPISNQANTTFNTPDNPATTGTVVTDADSASATINPPAVGAFFFQTVDDGVDTGNNPTSTADDDPTLITVVTVTPPSLRLVKRVTAIQAAVVTSYIDVVTGIGAAADNAPNWPNPSQTATKSDNSGTTLSFSALLQGVVSSSSLPVSQQPKPNDEVEYTIYFLSDGGKNAANVQLCDFVPANSTYVPNTLQLKLGTGTLTTITDAIADTDGGYYTAGFPAACTGINNSKGAIVVNVGTVNRSTGVGTPSSAYGFIRFRAKIN